MELLNECWQVAKRIDEGILAPFKLHGKTCRKLAGTHDTYLKTLGEQLQEASKQIGAEKLYCYVKTSLEELRRVMRNAEKFVRDCRCDGESDELWLKKAMTLGLSTQAVDVHLHDFLVVFCAVADAIGHALEQDPRKKCSTAKLLCKKYSPELLEPDIFWEQLGKSHNLLIDSEKLAKEIAEDRKNLAHRLASIAGKELNGEDIPRAKMIEQRLAQFLLQKLSDSNLPGHPADPTLPSYLFVNPEDFDYLGPISNDGDGNVLRVKWSGLDFAMSGVQFALKQYNERERFEQEAAMLVRLQHAHVVQIICCVERTKNLFCFVMELMDGDLRSFLEHTRLTLTEKVAVMLQIAKGMEYIHSREVIHRDVKTQNILVKRVSKSSRIQVKVADFGIAKAKMDGSSYTTKKVGTGVFRAPEVMLEEGDPRRYKKSADVYGFAMVCYEILTGEEPFHDYEGLRSELVSKIKAGERPKLGVGDCPPYLKSCMELWWDGKPSVRPAFGEICTTLRHVYGALLRCKEPLEDIPFLSWPATKFRPALHALLPRPALHHPPATAAEPILNIPARMFACRMAEISLQSDSAEFCLLCCRCSLFQQGDYKWWMQRLVPAFHSTPRNSNATK